MYSVFDRFVNNCYSLKRVQIGYCLNTLRIAFVSSERNTLVILGVAVFKTFINLFRLSKRKQIKDYVVLNNALYL
jgi:hypothetical protein